MNLKRLQKTKKLKQIFVNNLNGPSTKSHTELKNSTNDIDYLN